MTVGAGISVQEGNLNVLGNVVLNEVNPDVFVTPAAGDGLINAAFIGVQSDHTGSRRVFPIGKLEYVVGFLVLGLSLYCFILLFGFSVHLFAIL